MQRPAKKALVWIKWTDAVGESSRAHEDDLAGTSLARNDNLGWIIHENDSRIVLAHGYSNTGEVDHFTIPRANIESIVSATASIPRRKKIAHPPPENTHVPGHE